MYANACSHGSMLSLLVMHLHAFCMHAWYLDESEKMAWFGGTQAANMVLLGCQHHRRTLYGTTYITTTVQGLVCMPREGCGQRWLWTIGMVITAVTD